MPSKHAEMDVITKIQFLKNVPKYIDMFVIRINKNGKLGESRPCIDCLKMLNMSKFIIKNIYYSTSEGLVVKEKFSNMLDSSIKNYTSSGRRSKNRNK